MRAEGIIGRKRRKRPPSPVDEIAMRANMQDQNARVQGDPSLGFMGTGPLTGGIISQAAQPSTLPQTTGYGQDGAAILGLMEIQKGLAKGSTDRLGPMYMWPEYQGVFPEKGVLNRKKSRGKKK